MTLGSHRLVLMAILALAAAVAAYGWSGLRLARGSRDSGGALRSGDWWIGTALQGVGFLTALVARMVLPLLLVESAIAGLVGLTRGLARGLSVTVLSGDYLLATIVPSLFGVFVLGEHRRPGLTPLAVVGLIAAVWGTHRLLGPHA